MNSNATLMKNLLKVILVAVFTLFYGIQSSQAQTLCYDVPAPVGGSNLGTGNVTPRYNGQTFTACETGVISSASMRLGSGSNATDIEFRIYDGAGVGGTLLFTGTPFDSSALVVDTTITVTNTGAAVVSGQLYTMLFYSVSGDGDVFVKGDPFNPYADGGWTNTITTNNGAQDVGSSVTISPPQFGPAGVVSGIRLWLDATDINGGATNPNDGDDVTSWTDKSGTGATFSVRPANAATGELARTPPTYTTDGGTLFNNQPVVDFDIGDVLEFDVTDYTSDHTIFIIFNQQSAPSAFNGFFASTEAVGGTTPFEQGFQISVDAGATKFSHLRSAATSSITDFENVALNELKLYAFTNTSGTVATLVDGVPTGNTTTAAYGNTFLEYALNSNRGGNQTNDMQLAEVLIYDRVLTSCEIATINNYLGIKYGNDFSGVPPQYDEASATSHPNPHTTSGLFTGIGVFPSSGCPPGSELVADTAGENGVLGGLTASIVAPYDTNHNLDLTNGDEYTTFGYDSGGLTEVASNAPGYEMRIQRTWAVDQDDATGTDFIENFNINFNITGVATGKSESSFALLIDDDGDGNFSNARIHREGLTVVDNDNVSFTKVDFPTDGAVFTLATDAPGPGNVSGGLALWLKADAGVTGVTPITGWDDQSGNGINVATVNGDPALQTDTFNFNAAIDFDGTGDYLETVTQDLGDNLTFFVVGDRRAAGSHLLNHDPDFNVQIGGAGLYGGAFENFNDNALNRIDFRTGIINRNASSFLRTNGTQGNNPTAGSSSGGDLAYTIGANAGGLTPLDGRIAEIVVYNANIDTGTQLRQVESYLAVKYGITLNNGGTAYLDSAGNTVWTVDATYDSDIFGIANDEAQALDQQISKSVNTGAILTLSTDTNFTNANGTHASLTDGQFLMAGNNGGSTGNQITELPTGLTNTYGARIGREWKLVNTGAVASVNLQFDSFDDTYEVLLDDDGDFSNGGTSSLGALNASGQLLGETGLTGTSYITLARTVTPFNCDGTLYQVYLNGGNYELVTIDPITGNFSTGVNLTALGLPGNGAWAYNPVDNLAYYVHSASPYELYQLDATNKLTFLGNITGGLSGDINAGAMATDGTFYVMSATNQNVYSIDLSTKTASLVVTVPATSDSLADIGVNPVDGNLYGRRAANGQLVQITPAGVVTNIGAPQTDYLGTGAVYFTAAGEMIGYADNPSTGAVNTQETLLKADLTDGTVTPIATGPSTIGNDGFSCAFSLVLEKGLAQPASSPGGTNTYTFTFTNQSGGALTNISFADALTGGYLWASEPTNLTGGITLGATSINGTATGNFTITSLPVGESSFDIDLQVPATAVLGSTFDNQATLTGLPSGISATVVSDDPNTAVVEDATTLNIIASPGNVSENLALWLKADGNVYNTGTTQAANGQNIETWVDASGQTHDHTQSTATNQPTFIDGATNAGTMNFNPSLDFTDDYLEFALNDNLGITDDHSFYIVRRADAGPNLATTYSITTPTGNINTAMGLSNYRSGNRDRYIVQNDSQFTNVSDAHNDDETAVGSYHHTDALEGTHFVDGESLQTIARPLALDYAANFRSAVGRGFIGTGLYDGDIAEIIVYASNNSAEAQKIESYLALKYGITLNNGATAYKSSDGADFWTVDPTYNQDIFGIGRDDASALGQVQSKSVNANGIVTILAEAEGTNAANTFVDIADKEFLMVSSDTGAATWNVTGAPAGITKLSRTWRVQETGDVGTTQLDFDVADTDFDVPNLVSGTSYLFLYDSDDDDDLSDETPVTMTNPSGDIWRVSGINFTTGMEFTIASGNGFDISGIVYYDEDGEGDLDAGETTRLQDVTITLYNDVDDSDDFSTGDTVVGSATSSAASTGAYTFATVVPGEYVIVVDHADTALNNDANNGNITYGATTAKEIAVTVSNAAITDRNFGFDQAEVSLAVDEATINESGTAPSVATFTATIAPTTGFATTVNLAFSGTATGSGTDYTASGSSISIAADGTSGTVTATVAADTEVEVNETIIVDIDTVTNAVEQATQQATTTIADDDSGALTISIAQTTDGAESATPTNAQFTVSLDGGATNNTGSPITGTIALTGTATVGSDYTNVTAFSIANGDSNVVVDIPILNDSNVEVTETIIATISAPNVGAVSATDNAMANVTDDDSGALTISIGSPVDGTEGTSDITFTVSMDGSLTNSTGAAITGTVALTGTATNGTDYTDVTTFSIADGASSGTVTVSVTDDSDIEVSETVIATISAPSVGAVSATDNATANILDDDATALTVSIGTPMDGTEGTSDVTFTVSLDGSLSNGTGAAITGTVAITGTATNGTDYTDVTTFSIADGASSGTVTVTVTDDSNIEVSETVIATISAPSTGAIGTAMATANILDDDAGALTLSIGTPVDGTEGTSDVTFTVSLDGGTTNGTGAAITGTVALTGTATNGTDYTDVTTFSIADGASSGTITVTVTDDSNIEVSETVIATISAPSTGAVGTAMATANILDDDAGALTLSIGTPVDGTEGTSDVTFTVSLDGGTTNGTGAAITGTVALTGTATNGTDYTDVTTFSIADGASSGTITVTVTDDSDVEVSETVIATISAPSTGTIGTAMATANILDDDAGALTLSIGTPVDGTEGTSDVTFTVSLDGGTTNGTGAAITGTVALTGTATNGTDYTDVTTFSIADGASSGTITVMVTDDSNIEVLETVIATISAPSTGAIGTAMATANILDDDAGALTVSIGTPVDGTEGTSDVTFTVSLDGGATNGTGSAITGTVALTGTATNGTDYTDVTTFSIADGASSGTITVAVTDDSDVEVSETVIATISAPSVGAVSATDNATANIIDDDAAALTVSIGTPVDGTEGGTDISYTVSLDGGLSNDTGAAITGTVALTGTATNGTDYTDVTAFSIADGASSGTITITVTDDTVVELSETVIATISAPSVGTVGTAAATANINDNDNAELSIVATTQAAEDTTDGLFSISTTQQFSSPVLVNFTVAGTATDGTDYTTIGSSFSFPANQNTATIPIAISLDGLFENDESVIITLDGTDNAAVTIAASPNNSASIIITDNDAVTVELTASDATAAEVGGDTGEFTATLSSANNTGAPILIPLTMSGTATDGTDYTSITQISIADGASSGTVTLTVSPDTLFENDETATATLGTLPTGVSEGTATTADVVITDDPEDASNAVLAQIGNEGDDPDMVNSVVTVAQMQTILPLVTGLVLANEMAYQDYIDANPDDFDVPATQPQVQAMVNAVNASQDILAQIGDEGDDPDVVPSAVTVAELGTISPTITDLDPTNETAYQEHIDANPNDFSAPATVAEVQATVDAVNASQDILAQIGDEGDDPDVVPSAVTVAELGTISPTITDLDPTNETAYQDYIDANPDDFSAPTTQAEVQAMVDAVNASQDILAQIGDEGDDPDVVPSAVTVAELGTISPTITDLDPTNETAYQEYIDANPNDFSAPATVAEVQATVDAVNASQDILAQIGNEGDDPDVVPSAVTVAELGMISPAVINLVPANEIAYQNYIDANPDDFSAPTTQAEVQAMVDAVNASQDILAQIGDEGDDPDVVPSAVTVAELGTISPAITGLDPTNETAYQEYIDANPNDFSAPATVAEVQTTVDAVNASQDILAQIGDEGDDPDVVPSAVTVAELGTISPAITGLDPTNETAYQEYIDANPNDFSAPAIVAEVQTLVNAVNASQGILAQIGNEGDDPDMVNSVVTVAELGMISPAVINLVPTNQTAYQDYIDENPDLFSEPATQAEVQSMVSAVNTSQGILAQIGNEGDDPNVVPSIVTVAQLGMVLPVVTDLVVANEIPYQEYIDANPNVFAAPATQAEVQAMVTAVNMSQDVLTQIGNEGDDPNMVPSTVTVAELMLVSPTITDLNPTNEMPYQEYIDANPNSFSEPATQAEVQTMVDAVNTSQDVLVQIGNEGDDPDTVNSVVTVAELGTISPMVTGLVAANETAYQDYIDANPNSFSEPATQAEVQAMVDAVNTSQDVLAQIGNEGDDPDTVPSVITVAELQTISPALTDLTITNEIPYQEYIDANPNMFSSPATQSEVQAMVTAVNTSQNVLTQIGTEGDNPDVIPSVVTVMELQTVSPALTDLVSANEALYQEYIDNNPDVLSAPATQAEVQAMVIAVNTAADGTNVNTVLTATSPIAADGNTSSNVFLQLADTQGNLLTSGGDDVTFSSTGSAIQVGPVIDFGNGNYAAEFVNLTGETVTISGIVNNKPITSTAIVEFLTDTDNDGDPDITDDDDDGDGQTDADEIACGSDPLDVASTSPDADGDNLPNCSDPDDDNDGIADVLDDDDDNDGQSDEDEIACGSDPLDPQSKALDSDGDNIPDCTDEDDDGDGQSDEDEIACGSDPLDGAAISPDNDLDGIPNCADPDDDNDGTPDVEDTDDDNDGISDADEVTCGSDPNDSTDAALDTDGDGIPDCVDEDDDGDGTPDEEDAFPLDETEDTDTDGDGEGDNADEDADNDGILDEDDLEPTLPYDPNADDDMDGFPNSVEDLNGDGNPYNDDSNGDGMADFLDPYDAGADDDNDGIPNGVENENKDSNPFNNDCDSDGTPDFLDADPCGITSAGAFTPNGDGINDTWVIQDIESYPFNTVKVYSRYGHEVFGARSYQNDWLGGYQDSSDKLPAGSYYYQINLGDGSPPIDGWLFINY